MKTIEQKAEAYNKAIDRVKKLKENPQTVEYSSKDVDTICDYIFPELKEEQRTDDETLRKNLIKAFNTVGGRHWGGLEVREILTWLEKQSTDISSFPKEQQVFMKKYTSFDKITLIKLLAERDANNTEIIKSFEKKGEQNPADKEYTFKAIPRLLEMVEPTKRAKAYCQKLIDSLTKEGYVVDAKIVGEYLRQMNGEDVPMATMDEQKPIDKVDPKFSEGEWITNSEYTWKVVDIKPLDYILQSQDGNIVDDSISYVDEQFHSFTVKDAKDGDVLVTVDGERPFIYKGCLDPKHPDSPVAYCGINAYGYFHSCSNKFNHWWTEAKVHPATKEQKDALFVAMKDAGYEWDAERKKSKLLISNGGDFLPEVKESEDDNINEETNAPTEYGKYIDECLNKAAKHFFSEGEDKYSVADLFYFGVRCGQSCFEKQGREDYNPYKVIIKSIAELCERYSRTKDWKDFYDNVIVKCKDAIEYDKANSEEQGKSNSYSSVSFKYNGHTWGMCARDNGVEILVDGEIKERVSLDNKPQGKTELEAIKEEKVYNQNCVEPIDNVKLKFHKGDWIVFNGLVLYVKEVVKGFYRTISIGGIYSSYDWNIDNSARLWTLQDARDGNVLYAKDRYCYFKEYLFVFSSLTEDNVISTHFCYDVFHGTFDKKLTRFGRKEDFMSVTPATKEQCNTLMQAMADAGYTFDFDSDKKELKKIEEKPQLKEGKFYECIKSYHHLCGSEYWFDEGKVYFCEKDGYLRSSKNNLINVYDCENWQNYFRTYTEKPLWSEEDERLYRGLQELIYSTPYCNSRKKISDWLKSLKQRRIGE